MRGGLLALSHMLLGSLAKLPLDVFYLGTV